MTLRKHDRRAVSLGFSGRGAWLRLGQGLSALGLILTATSAHAAVIDVGGGCTLEAAITAANADAVVGGCPAGSGADTINLPANSTIVLTSVADPFGGGTGLPAVTSTITINGEGSLITRDPGAPDFSLIGVNGGDLTLNETTLSGASIAAVFTEYGALKLNECVLTGNDDGVGLFSRGTEVDVSRSSISENGAGIFSVFDSLDLFQTSVVLNDSYGVSLNGTFFFAENSTFSSNGGPGVDGFGYAKVKACTVTGNADVGLGMSEGYAFDMEASIIAGNHGTGAGREVDIGYTTDERYNVFGFAGDPGIAGFTPEATDIFPSGPLSSVLDTELGAHGGIGLTHTIRIGGPADGAWLRCYSLTVDQKNHQRPSEHCDVGAVEMMVDICANLSPGFGCTVNGVPNQRCVGTSGDDTIIGGIGSSPLLGRGGNDTLVGDRFSIVCGGDGDDTITGSAFSDQLFGGPGNDTIFSGGGLDGVLGGLGVDSCEAGSEAHAIQGCE